MATLDQINLGLSVAVVTCHNYGRYLRQCLESLLAQTMPFDHIIVVNDSSTDDTAEICQEFSFRGIQILTGEWGNFTQARLAGLAALPRPRFLTFVDADNWLDPDFHSKLRQEMEDPKVGVAYPIKRNVDGHGEFLVDWCPEFDHRKLRSDNLVDACALIRIEAYEQVGGWEAVDGLTDWLLWLKISRAGWHFRHSPGAILFYRRHGECMGIVRGRTPGRHLKAVLDVYRRGTVTTIVTLFAGREWMLPRYVEFLQKLKWPREALRLVAIDNSRNPEFSAKLREALAKTGIQTTIVLDHQQVVQDMPANELADNAVVRSRNGYALSRHLARLYSLARQEMPQSTDFVWCLEDDIEPPADALERHLESLYRHKEAGVASGCVRNRFGGGRLIAWQGNWRRFLTNEEVFQMPEFPEHGVRVPIMATGFFCALFRREVWEGLIFRPSPLWHPTRRPWYDWSAGLDVHRQGKTWILDGSVHCLHWQADGTYL